MKTPLTPSQQQRADWVYGNTVLSNPNITREMCEDAVRYKDSAKRPLAELETRLTLLNTNCDMLEYLGACWQHTYATVLAELLADYRKEKAHEQTA